MPTLKSTAALLPASSLTVTLRGTSPGLADCGDWTSILTSLVEPFLTEMLEICFWSKAGWKKTFQSLLGALAARAKVLSLPVLLAMVALNSNLEPLAPFRMG